MKIFLKQLSLIIFIFILFLSEKSFPQYSDAESNLTKSPKQTLTLSKKPVRRLYFYYTTEIMISEVLEKIPESLMVMNYYTFRKAGIEFEQYQPSNGEMLNIDLGMRYINSYLLGTLGLKIGKKLVSEDQLFPYVTFFLGLGTSPSSGGITMTNGLGFGLKLFRWGPLAVSYDFSNYGLINLLDITESANSSNNQEFFGGYKFAFTFQQ